MLQQTDQNNLNSVRGWLLLLCLILCVISPVLYLVTISFNPSMLLIVSGVAMSSYGFIAGYKLWRIKKGAVKFARTFLTVLISVNACIALAVALFVSPEAAARDLAGIIWPSVWFLYLRRSVRVAKTYAEPLDGGGAQEPIVMTSLLAERPQSENVKPNRPGRGIGPFSRGATKDSMVATVSAGAHNFLKTAIVMAVILVAAFGCLLLLRPLMRYKYLKRGPIQYRYNRYSGRTDRLTGVEGWEPIAFDRPLSDLPVGAIVLSQADADTDGRVCFNVENTSHNKIKSLTVRINYIGALKRAFDRGVSRPVPPLNAQGYPYDPQETTINGFNAEHANVELTLDALLYRGMQRQVCTDTYPAVVVDPIWTYTVLSVKGWEPSQSTLRAGRFLQAVKAAVRSLALPYRRNLGNQTVGPSIRALPPGNFRSGIQSTH